MNNPKNIKEIIMTPINKVKPYPLNTKQHPRAQIDRIAHSIAVYGFDSPIVVDEEGVIIKGHGRYFASQKLNLKEVPVVTHDYLTEEEKKLSRIADNKVAESEWDTEMLWDEMKDLQSSHKMDLKDFGMKAQTAKTLFPDQDLSIFGLNQTEREKEYDKYNEDKEAGKHDIDDDAPETDATEVRIESFMNAFTGEKRYLRHLPMIDYLNSFDKLLVGISGGKDSIHEESKMWFRIDGVIHYTTPGELLDELLEDYTEEENEYGQIIVTPVEKVETITPTSMYQRDAKVVFKPVKYIMYHVTDKLMYEVTTHTGDSVRVTEDHSLVSMKRDWRKGLYIKNQTTDTKNIKVADMLPVVKRLFVDTEDSIKQISTFKSKDKITVQRKKIQSKYDIQASKVKSIQELLIKDRRVFDFEVEDSNHLFIADNIVVHNSTTGFSWIMENIQKDKIIPYFGDLGWGIDWSCAVTYVKMLEKMYDIKIICSGDVDPSIDFEQGLLQYGFPHPVSCWVRNHIKIKNTKKVQMHVKQNNNICVILFVRWAESENRRKTYSDRGILKDGNMYFASPILRWSDTDVCKFLQERDLKLPTPYQHSDRMGCQLCPNNDRKTGISVRKKFPKQWRQILEWHARGARRTRGDLALFHLKKFVSSLDDLTLVEKETFASILSPLALGPKAYEEYLEEKLGGKLPCENYTRIPYDEKYHNFPNDTANLKDSDDIMALRTDCKNTNIFGCMR